MRTCAVVIDAPPFDLFAGLAQRIKRVLVQAFVSKLAVKAFDVGILGGFPWCDVVQAHMPIASPDQHGQAREFRAVVHDQGFGIAAMLGNHLEDAGDAMAGD
jgi:hypothetical protein